MSHNQLFLDTETTEITIRETSKLPDTIHTIYASFNDEEPVEMNLKQIQEAYRESDEITGHNIIAFDKPVLEKFKVIHKKDQFFSDTLVMSRAFAPFISDQDGASFNGTGIKRGSHSLAAWGHRLDNLKGDYKGGWGICSQDMKDYCKQDVRLLPVLYKYLKQSPFYSEDVFQREMSLQHILSDIYLRGVRVTGIQDLKNIIENDIKSSIVELNIQGFEGNLNSRQQMGKFLIEKGWKPENFTEKTKQPKVSVDFLTDEDIPAVRSAKKYYMCQKPLSQCKSIENNTSNKGLVHPVIASCAARTTRCTHYNPNVAQIPQANHDEDKSRWELKYGTYFRALFKPGYGAKMVGADISNQEFALMADVVYHLTGEKRLKELAEAGESVHNLNMESTGISDKSIIKPLYFAMIYGARDPRLGATAIGEDNSYGELVAEGSRLRDLMGRGMHGFNEAVEILQKQTEEYNSILTLNNRRIYNTNKNAAMNTAVQGLAAEQSKLWCLNMYQLYPKDMKKHHRPLLFNHDEWQYSSSKPNRMKPQLIKALEKTKKQLNLTITPRCDVSIGDNWSQTH